MKIGTANIQNFPDLKPRQVAQDASTIARHCTLAGLQEIQPHEDTPVVSGALGDDWWLVAPVREVPIVGRKDRWVLLDHWVVPFDRPSLPRPENRHAGVVSVIVRSARKRHLPPFAVVNTHLVAGGFNGDELPVIRKRWEIEWGLYRDEALRLHRQGLTVFTVGDLNRPAPPIIGVPLQGFQWFGTQKGPDHIGQLPHERSVQLGSPRGLAHVPLNSDHALSVVSGPLEHAD